MKGRQTVKPKRIWREAGHFQAHCIYKESSITNDIGPLVTWALIVISSLLLSQDEQVGEAGSLEGCYQDNMAYQGLENPCPFPSPILFNPLELSLIPLLLSWLFFFLESSSPFHSPTCRHLGRANFPLCVPAQLRPHFSQRAHCSSAPHVDRRESLCTFHEPAPSFCLWICSSSSLGVATVSHAPFTSNLARCLHTEGPRVVIEWMEWMNEWTPESSCVLQGNGLPLFGTLFGDQHEHTLTSWQGSQHEKEFNFPKFTGKISRTSGLRVKGLFVFQWDSAKCH